MARQGRVNRRTGGPVPEALTETLPRPFADITKRAWDDRGIPAQARLDTEMPPARARRVRTWTPPLPLAKPLLRSSAERRSRGLSFLSKLRADPRVGFCLKRGIRREVLFAMRVAGSRGVGRGKKWKRNYNSQWRC